MKIKRIHSLLAALIMLTALIPSMVSARTASSEMVVDLIAGQHTDAGDVRVWNDSEFLYVDYSTAAGWCLNETHLQVASNLDGIPQANGNPIPGQFEYKATHNCVSNFTYTVPLITESCDLYIAAHAVVDKKNGKTETAWGSGIDFPGRNWATYFIYSVDGCDAAPGSTATFTPTATNTFTQTATNTLTATATSTATSTATFTPTATNSFTPTATNTPTSTATATVCQPTVIVADFSRINVGASVEGVGVVAPYLDIDAKGTAVKVSEATLPKAYSARNNDTRVLNGGIATGGGFSDTTSAAARQAHQYTFTFAGIAVSDFSLHMLDYGDWNPTLNTDHSISLTAYDSNGTVVTQKEISYTTQAVSLPRSSIYGDLYITGDALTSSPGQLGNWTWNLSGSGIVKIALEFGPGFDPNVGFDTLNFTTECLACQTTTRTADFSRINVGASVEGVGVVAPYLDIDAKGTAVKVSEATLPKAYSARNNDTRVLNGGIATGGGFSDTTSAAARQAHQYTFTFAGIAVSDFSLHMLDYGDWNPTLNTDHSISLTAYDSNGTVVTQKEISYTTQAVSLPRSSIYGDLYITGDALTSSPGQLGNWTWNLSGSGIVKIALEFGPGFDPNVGFDTLSSTTECP